MQHSPHSLGTLTPIHHAELSWSIPWPSKCYTGLDPALGQRPLLNISIHHSAIIGLSVSQLRIQVMHHVIQLWIPSVKQISGTQKELSKYFWVFLMNDCLPACLNEWIPKDTVLEVRWRAMMCENRKTHEDKVIFQLDSCYGLNCASLNSYVEVLTPRTSYCDYIWRQSL